MKLPTRFGLVGIVALSLLSLGHWVRENVQVQSAGIRYCLGVLPNFAAALAIPFVIMSAWADRDETRDAVPDHAWRFRLCAAFAFAGLVAWEFLQLRGPRLVFDTDDIIATAVGTAMAFVTFRLVAPKAEGDFEAGAEANDGG